MNVHRRFWSLVGLAVLLASSIRAGEKAPLTADPLTSIALLPAAEKFAETHRIPISGIDWGNSTAAPRKGDSVTLLVTLYRGDAIKQWLATIEADELDAKEQKLTPTTKVHWFTSNGREFDFTFSRTALRVYFAGPFAPVNARQPTPTESRDRAVISPEALQFGLDRYCRLAMSINERALKAGVTDQFYIAGGYHMSEADLKRGKAVGARLQFTEAEERLVMEPYHNLWDFFQAATQNAAFRGVLEEVLRTPSLWSIAKNRGVRTSLDYHWSHFPAINPVPAAAPLPVYHLPVQVWMNGELGLRATLAVTTPNPPLQACAGIVALCAEHPDHADRRLFIHLLSANRAPDDKTTVVSSTK
jgi:hypothetical protein